MSKVLSRLSEFDDVMSEADHLGECEVQADWGVVWVNLRGSI